MHKKNPAYIVLTSLGCQLQVCGGAVTMIASISNHVGFDLATANLWLSSGYLCQPDLMDTLSGSLQYLVRPPWATSTTIDSSQMVKVSPGQKKI